MKIYLSPETRIRDIKASFNRQFPYLKLEFFNRKHLPGQGNSYTEMMPDAVSLRDISGKMTEGNIEINPGDTVSDLEQRFQYKFSIPVQVFRRSINSWIETLHTDRYTLFRQNKMGKESSNAIYDHEILL